MYLFDQLILSSLLYFSFLSTSIVRTIRQEWLVKSSGCIKAAFKSTDDGKFDVSLRNGFEYESQKSNIKSLLERTAFMMSTVLVGVVMQVAKCLYIFQISL